MSNIIQAFPKGSGGGGGHTILDSSGTATAQESNLQFTGLSVTDDSANGKTEVAGEGLNADSIDDIASANTINPAVIIGDANNYSTSEKVIGKWVDGSLLYQKTISFGSLPNASMKDLSIFTANTVKIKKIFGYSYRPSDGMTIELPRANPTAANCISVDVITNQSTIRVTTGGDYSSFTETYVTLQYTKTT